MGRSQLQLRAKAVQSLIGRTLGRLVFSTVPSAERHACFLGIQRAGGPLSLADLAGYAALLLEDGAQGRLPAMFTGPQITGYADLRALAEHSVLAVQPPAGTTHILYRPDSRHNFLFATGRCNSHCLMCSQPPVLTDDTGRVEEYLRLIDLIAQPPAVLGITGGEPTLLGDGLIRLLTRLRDRFPNTPVHLLTNARLYAYEDFVRELAAVGHSGLLSSIPLYADVAAMHDSIVQVQGAFDQTLTGLYHTARFRLRTEIRVVLHQQTLPRLIPLMEFIYRNLPFVSHVALMGLENMGYARKNWERLWIDPLDYADVLEQAVRHLFYRKLPVSIYNLPLCLLPQAIWPFARQSIADYKTLYLPECRQCDLQARCSGLFASCEIRHSHGIHPLTMAANEQERIFNGSLT